MSAIHQNTKVKKIKEVVKTEFSDFKNLLQLQ
jgi:hypothetical protein